MTTRIVLIYRIITDITVPIVRLWISRAGDDRIWLGEAAKIRVVCARLVIHETRIGQVALEMPLLALLAGYYAALVCSQSRSG